MKLLLAVDSIVTTEMLLNVVSSRPWPLDTEALVLSVVEDDEVAAEVWREAGYGPGAVRQEMRTRGNQMAAFAVGRLRQNGISAEVIVKRGDPAWLILHAAREWAADLIIIRAHNRMNLRRWMLGSVAKSVIGDADCSVEVVRAEAAPSAVQEPKRILLATEGSEGALAATRFVAESIWPPETEVKVVSTVNPLLHSLEEIGLYRSGRIDRAHRVINESMQVLKDAGVKVSGEVMAGRPSRRIIDEAKSWGASLIVLGSGKRRGFLGLLSSSVSEIVANRAHCSVRIISSRDRSTEVELPRGSNRSRQNVPAEYRSEEDIRWRKVA